MSLHSSLSHFFSSSTPQALSMQIRFVKKGCKTGLINSLPRIIQCTWWRGPPTCPAPACWSISARRRIVRTRWSHHLLSTWASWCWEAEEWSPSVSGQSEMSAYMVALPDRTLLALRSLWMLISHYMMELNVVLWLHRIPYPGRKAGREPQGNRTTSCQ